MADHEPTNDELEHSSAPPAAASARTETDAVFTTDDEPVPPVVAHHDPQRDVRLTRLLLPVLLPVGAAVMIAGFVLNVSRMFLAAGSTGAIVLGVALIVLILGGAAGISAAPRLRTSSIVMMVSAASLVIVSAGLVAAPASVETNGGSSGYVAPAGPPVAVLEVDALATTRFQASHFTLKAGVVEIDYVSKDGPHTLAFDPPGPSNFLLNVPGNGTVKSKVLLKAGQGYTIYCTLPGHRALGMQATIFAQ